MIKLIQLLREVTNSPKAIIMAGAAGVGKGTFIKDIESKHPQTIILNPDDFYVPQLKAKGVSLDLKNTFKNDREAMSKSGEAMATARGEYEKKIKSSLGSPILIFDITSNSYDPILKLKTRLEENGYEVMMVYLYASLDTVLDRNDKRYEKSGGEERSIQPTAVVNTWKGVVSNFEKYQQLFGDNFISTTTDKTPVTSKSFKELKNKYITPYNPPEKVINLPKDVEDDFNKKIKSLGSLNKFEVLKLKEKALAYYNKYNQFMPLEKQGRTNGFIENLNSIKKESKENEQEKEEFLKLLEPNNPIIQAIILSFKSKDEVLNKVNIFLG